MELCLKESKTLSTYEYSDLIICEPSFEYSTHFNAPRESSLIGV